MTGGEILVECLKKQGVKAIFGMPGNHINHIYAGLYKSRDAIKHILVRHEGGASLMADGYARVTGDVGVCLTIPGPGASNAYTGMLEAYTTCSPVLLITGQNDSRYAKKDPGKMFHGLDQLSAFSAVTKLTKRVEKVEEIPEAVNEVFGALRSGRPKPVLMELTTDALSNEADLEIPERNDGVKLKATEEQLRQTIDLLVQSERPFILAGRGIHHADASPELLEFAKTLNAPVTTSAVGKGAISEYEHLSLGDFTGGVAREAMSQSDLFIAIGTRFTQMDTGGWSLQIPRPFIHIESDPDEINKEYTADVGIAGDAKLVLRQLLEAMKGQKRQDGWEGKLSDFKKSVESAEQPRLIRELRQIMDKDAILSVDVHIAGYPARRHFKVCDSKSFIYSSILISIGCAFSQAIGAKVAFPNKQVVAFCGDGGFLLGSPEMATIMKHNIKVVVIVMNDNALGSVRGGQMRLVNDTLGVELYNPDFVKFAESFGAYGFRVGAKQRERASPLLDDFAPTVERALTLDKPTLVEVSGMKKD